MQVYRAQGPTATSPFAGLVGYFLRTKGPTGFSSGSTAAEVAANWDGSGKVALITGASGGLGAEAARVLASRGAEVVIAARDAQRSEAVIGRIRSEVPDAKVSCLSLDLSSLEAVRAAAAEFKARGKPLHVLMLNAGVMACPFMLSEDGHEMQLATNHYGHYLLTLLLKDLMIDTAQRSGSEGRIVVLSSVAHFFTYSASQGGPIRFDKLDSPEGYAPWPAYGVSKLANILFTRELHQRLAAQQAPVKAVCCHPGGILETDLSRHAGMGPGVKAAVTTLMAPFFKTTAQGAATQVLLATAPTVLGGEYYGDCNLQGCSQASKDSTLGRKLWDITAKVCGI